MTKSSSEDQALSKLMRNVSAGDYLFRQGEMGNTMFLILDGTVELFRQAQHVERLVWTLGTGEMIGEKAILTSSPYRRTVTAQAKSLVRAIEFDSKNLKVIQEKFPDFTTKLLKMLSERLDQANELISILQTKEDVNRAIQYLLFFAGMHACKIPSGVEVTITAKQIAHAVNITEDQVATVLEELTRQKLLSTTKTGYIITDVKLLESNIAQIKTSLAA